MNPLIITISIAAAAFILSIFGAGWLNLHYIQRMLDQQTKLIDAKLEGIRAEFSGELRAVRGELHNLTARVERLERQSEDRFSRIERQLDAIFKPIISKTGD